MHIDCVQEELQRIGEINGFRKGKSGFCPQLKTDNAGGAAGPTINIFIGKTFDNTLLLDPPLLFLSIAHILSLLYLIAHILLLSQYRP